MLKQMQSTPNSSNRSGFDLCHVAIESDPCWHTSCSLHAIAFLFFFLKKWSFLFLYNTNTHFIQRGYSSLLQMHSPSVGKKTYSGIELEVEQTYEIAGFNMRITFATSKPNPLSLLSFLILSFTSLDTTCSVAGLR